MFFVYDYKSQNRKQQIKYIYENLTGLKLILHKSNLINKGLRRQNESFINEFFSANPIVLLGLKRLHGTTATRF